MKPIERTKQVRILHQRAHGSKDIFDQLSEQRDSYLQHLENITKFSKAGKKKQQDNTYKVEWLDERKRLDQLTHKVEQSVNQLVQMLLMQDVQNSVWHNYMQEQDNAQTERNNLKSTYRKQLQEIKALHSDYAFQGNGKKASTANPSEKRTRPSRHAANLSVNAAPIMRSQSSDSARKPINSTNGENNNDDLISRNNDIIAAYLAELYLAIHSQQSSAYATLEAEENTLTKELKTMSKYFHSMIVEDELEQQSADYEEEVADLLARIQQTAERIELLHSQYQSTSTTTAMSSGSTKADPPPSSSSSSSSSAVRWTLSQLFTFLLSQSAYEPHYHQLTSLYTQLHALDSQYYQNNTTANGAASLSTPRSTFSSASCSFNPQKWTIRAQDCFHKWKTKASFSGMARNRFVQLVMQELNHLSLGANSKTAAKLVKRNSQGVGSNKGVTMERIAEEESVQQEEEEEEEAIGEPSDLLAGEREGIAEGDSDKVKEKDQIDQQSSLSTPRTTRTTTSTATTSSLFTVEDLLSYEQYYEQKRKLSQQAQQQEQQYFTARESLFTQITTLLTQIHTQAEEEHEELQTFYAFQSQKQAVSTRLASLQAEYQRRKEKEDALRAQQEAEAQEAQLRQAEREALRREHMKTMLSEYHTLQAQREAAAQQAEAQRQAEQLKARQEERKQNAPKIEYRQQLYEQKLQQMKAKEEELMLQEEKKLECLLHLAEQVPYFQAIQDIAPRYDQLTFTAQQGQYLPIPDDLNLAKQRGHMPLLGFTDQKVIRDTRFRIMEALRVAGLQHTQAAKEVVQQYHPRPHLAIHGIL